MTCWARCPGPSGRTEDVGALGHEVHSAKDNVFGVGLSGDFGELVAVPCVVGEANDLIALVVMAEEDGGRAQLGACCSDTRVHGVIGEGEIVF